MLLTLLEIHVEFSTVPQRSGVIWARFRPCYLPFPSLSVLESIYIINLQLVSEKHERKKKQRTNGPSDMRRVVWARFVAAIYYLPPLCSICLPETGYDVSWGLRAPVVIVVVGRNVVTGSIHRKIISKVNKIINEKIKVTGARDASDASQAPVDFIGCYI